ncbi:hypothetical protein QOZ80_5BG0454250 [Eleusine coracana subsp. coracana]|nr:hypothetical protein QOZ80_5BG0454250 [Eleusine coracana subsp. coracana]
MATLGSGGVDRISGLPDDLLHCILIRLRSTRAAARTSVLSRRWRRVWAHLPELHLFYSAASARTHDRVDAALAASSAPAINHLEITASYLRTPRRLCRVPARRVSGWLRLASQRNLAGSLRLDVPYVLTDDDDDEDEDPVLLPVCDRATSIILELCRHKLRIIQVGGASFMALNTLTIWRARMDIQELEDVISSRCPNLKDLNLKSIVLKGGPRLSIRSDSLEQIEIRTSFQDTVEIAAPNLQKLTQVVSGDAYIAAPMLSELCWEGYFQPSRHHIIGPRRHLRRLNISINGLSNTLLMQQFDTVDELTLKIFDLKGTEQYERFLSEISRLSKLFRL